MELELSAWGSDDFRQGICNATDELLEALPFSHAVMQDALEQARFDMRLSDSMDLNEVYANFLASMKFVNQKPDKAFDLARPS